MKTNLRTSLAAVAIAFTAFTFASGAAQAQTENVTATVTVQNTLTITELTPLDFGTVVAVSDAVDIASLAIDATTSAMAASTTGAPAVFAVVDNTTASAAEITIEDGANLALINITINNVVDPIAGASTFDLLATGWETSWNGGATTARTAGTPFSYAFDGNFPAPPGVNTLEIGATLNTNPAVATYADGVYAGSFDVVFSY